MRWWIRLIPRILNAKTAVACAGQLTLLPRCEPAVLGAAHSAAIVSAPRVDDHGGAWRCTCRQDYCDRSYQTCKVENSHGILPLLFAWPPAYRQPCGPTRASYWGFRFGNMIAFQTRSHRLAWEAHSASDNFLPLAISAASLALSGRPEANVLRIDRTAGSSPG